MAMNPPAGERPMCRHCGSRTCQAPHDRQWADRPLGRRLAAIHPEPPESWRPAWLRQAAAKDMTGGLR